MREPSHGYLPGAFVAVLGVVATCALMLLVVLVDLVARYHGFLTGVLASVGRPLYVLVPLVAAGLWWLGRNVFKLRVTQDH
jgi:hypothetical protein